MAFAIENCSFIKSYWTIKKKFNLVCLLFGREQYKPYYLTFFYCQCVAKPKVVNKLQCLVVRISVQFSNSLVGHSWCHVDKGAASYSLHAIYIWCFDDKVKVNETFGIFDKLNFNCIRINAGNSNFTITLSSNPTIKKFCHIIGFVISADL